MPTGLEETLALITSAFSLYEAAGAIGGSGPTSSALQEKFLEDVAKRSVFDSAEPRNTSAEDHPVRSPVFNALAGIYYPTLLPRRSYVLWAPASSGKSAAARILMTKILPKLSNAPHGLMISGLAPNQDYFSHMACLLGAAGTAGWARALVQALMPDPRDNKRRPSILILDEFNSPGPNEINISFARLLYKAVVDLNIYLVFITQNKGVASTLCDLNDRSKITALPTAVLNPDAEIPEPFRWKNFLWGRKLLTVFVEQLDKMQDEQHREIFQEKDDEDAVPWIGSPMTPHQARWKYEKKIAELDQSDKEGLFSALLDVETTAQHRGSG